MRFSPRLKTYTTHSDGKTPTRAWAPWGHVAVRSGSNEKGLYVISYVQPLDRIAKWLVKNFKIKI